MNPTATSVRNTVSLLLVALGGWLIAAALTFVSSSGKMFGSDLVCGILGIILGVISMRSTRQFSLWMGGVLGLWLQMAPIFFWCPEALHYLNDTIVGALFIILSFIGNRTESPLQGGAPLGWSYNPSLWNHRIPTVALAFLCWFFSRYMAAFQLGYIDTIEDPFFGDGTLRVITSKISKDFPVSDAGMGAICYTLEALLGWQGDEERWHKMPWLVLIFGTLVVPVGIASITLIILQPVVVGAWCGWCLCTALAMLFMIIFTAGELVAVLQFLNRSCKAGKSLWKTLWLGSQGSLEGISKNTTSGWGITVPWNLVCLCGLGVWLMMSPSYFGIQGLLATSHYITGPLMVALAIISTAEPLRALRYLHILLGIALMGVAWFTTDPILDHLPIWNSYVVGCITILCALPRGKIQENYGSWDRWIF